jgi:hypothetical protein
MSLNRLTIRKVPYAEKSERSRLETLHSKDECRFTIPLVYFSSSVLYFYVADFVKLSSSYLFMQSSRAFDVRLLFSY